MAEITRYSRLDDTYGGSYVEKTVYENRITLTPRTQFKRNNLKGAMDNYCTFSWRGVNAFDVFGAFIINSGDLKFYNGPSFSNTYSKPQFETANGSLVGLIFNTQQISFKIGVYWISEEDYRQFIYWLNPYQIDKLIFNHQPNYYYLVKLAKREDSTRQIVGRDNGKDMYYTEMNLTFEIQGPACAYTVDGYEFNGSTNTYTLNLTDDFVPSDISTPCVIHSEIKWSVEEGEDISSNPTTKLSIDAKLGENGETTHLCDVTLMNIPFSVDHPTIKTIVYDSENGLFLEEGNSLVLLNRLTTSNGNRIVQDFTINKFALAGLLEDPNMKQYFDKEGELGTLKFIITLSNSPASLQSVNIDMRGRTNLI